MHEITPTELKEHLAVAKPAPLLLAVREPHEWAICRIAGSRLIPMSQNPEASAELDPDQETIVICHHGALSARVAMYLQQIGFSKEINLEGGTDAWAREVDPDMASAQST